MFSLVFIYVKYVLWIFTRLVIKNMKIYTINRFTDLPIQNIAIYIQDGKRMITLL